MDNTKNMAFYEKAKGEGCKLIDMERNKIPIAFCFDDNLLMQAGVCLTSLLENANEDTFYDIFILHDETSVFPSSGYLDRLKFKYSNFEITYRSVENIFDSAFQIRGITQATYYRLFIPLIIQEYDKIMYHDVDVIFRSDLREIFLLTDVSNCYIAGVVSPVSQDSRLKAYVEALKLNPDEYISAGNIIINSAKIREDNIMDWFRKEVLSSKYEFQDMDIINIICKGKIKTMPPLFCGTIEIFDLAVNRKQQSLFSPDELTDVLEFGIVHFNGPKPWNTWCPNLDIWWEYYRKSIYYDPIYYFNFFHSKLDEYDQLPLWKRIKILLRYFKTGKISK
jgi:UDP-glucose:(galactosyl)LPS alpha-1,2-glucosyltransferase